MTVFDGLQQNPATKISIGNSWKLIVIHYNTFIK